MFNKSKKLLAALIVSFALAPMSQAALSSYSQDFESLDDTDGGALAGDGWLVFANVFDAGGGYLYGYGPNPAPNGGPAFSAVAVGQGGAAQGNQQMVVYSDYNNGDHGNGNLIEANVFQEQIIGAGDVGSTWEFSFDAQVNDLAAPTTSLAFIKTLDPNAGFALSSFLIIDTTNVAAWNSYTISILINSGLQGHILQFGFASTATNFNASGVFYDNVNFSQVPVPAAVWLFGSALLGLFATRRRA
ncbi:MAG: PEP-CTERM sorting domain-containing protein [Pseudomonadota bacterium]